MGEWRDIPLIGQAYENVEDVQVDQWASTMVDLIPVIVEGKLQLMKRPGLTDWVTLGTNQSVDGIYWADRQSVLLVVSGGRVWKITDATGVKVELTGASLRTNSPVSFATDGTRVVMANGGNMVYTDFTTLTPVGDPDAPANVTHVAYLDGYILANRSDTGEVHFSDINDLTNWSAIDLFQASSEPDHVVALGVKYREIILLGRETVEFWRNDGQNPFSRVEGSAQPYGTEAPYSLAWAGQWMWLDHRRRFAVMNGQAVENVSTPYDRVIQRYASVNDAIGFSVSIDAMPLYVLSFPTARETLCYNYETKQWHKWGYWDLTRGIYQRYRGQSYTFARAWGLHVVGDWNTGMLYTASRQVFTDSGNPIRSLLRTGHITHDTDWSKRSDCVRLRCKRGAGNSAIADPQVMMRRRVNNKSLWTQERWKSLGQVGQHEPFIDWRRNGIYKSVQYEFVHTDATDFVLMEAQELITPLGR